MYSKNKYINQAILPNNIDKCITYSITNISYRAKSTFDPNSCISLHAIDNSLSFVKNIKSFRNDIKEDFITSYIELTLETIMGFKWASLK